MENNRSRWTECVILSECGCSRENRVDRGGAAWWFYIPCKPKEFSDICCLCRNTRGMLSLILSTRSRGLNIQQSGWIYIAPNFPPLQFHPSDFICSEISAAVHLNVSSYRTAVTRCRTARVGSEWWHLPAGVFVHEGSRVRVHLGLSCHQSYFKSSLLCLALPGYSPSCHTCRHTELFFIYSLAVINDRQWNRIASMHVWRLLSTTLIGFC